MSGLLLGMVLSVCVCWFHSMVTLPPLLVSTDFGTCSYQCFASNCTPISLHMLKCSCAPTLSCLFIYCSFASTGHADMMWSIVSSNWWHSRHLLSVSVFRIFVAKYFVFNAWSCAATISLSVSAFKSYYYYYYYYYYIYDFLQVSTHSRPSSGRNHIQQEKCTNTHA
jgi:hypothetical protein